MSRLKNYASALGSSYLALAANVVYSLVSVPLALSYLAEAEFGLWGLTFQIAGYFALIDLGMAGVSRILIDYKDRKNDSGYGSVILTSLLVSAVQAVLLLALGAVSTFGLIEVVRVPEALRRDFTLLVIGQCGVLAGGFVTRVFAYILAAHQRQDVLNYAQAFLFVGNLVVLWASFALGAGVYSILWAQLCGWLLNAIIAFIWCIRLRLFPGRECWGRPNWKHFVELFTYGRDIFLFVLGSQLVSASQIVIITRYLGLETAALWVICTRSYTLILQLVCRIFDNSCPALAEMIVRQEKQWLLQRFKSIVLVSGLTGVVTGLIFTACNQPFVTLWTGKAGWGTVNDALLALLLVLFVSARCHVGFAGQTKDFRLLRFIHLMEGVWFVALSMPLIRWGGIPMMLVVAITGTLMFSFPYGTWRTAQYFGLKWRDVAFGWFWPTIRLAAVLAPIALVIVWISRPLPALPRFMVCGLAMTAVGVVALIYWGLDRSLRDELFRRASSWLRKA